MSLTEHEVKIRTGRRDGDGHIRVALFTNELVALSLEGHGERAPTLLLTLEQVRGLQSALADLIPMVEAAEREENQQREAWQGKERRLVS